MSDEYKKITMSRSSHGLQDYITDLWRVLKSVFTCKCEKIKKNNESYYFKRKF